MTDNLTDKERAAKMRQAAALMTAAGYDGHAGCWEARADKLDPPDPFAHLDDDQWVEVEHRSGGFKGIMPVSEARDHRLSYAVIRALPEGDAREVLVIPVETAREHLGLPEDAWDLVRSTLAAHKARWSS